MNHNRETSIERILPAEAAWDVTRRFYAARDSALRDVGFFAHLQRIERGLFHGDPWERR
jgi:hypothetical protein